MKVADILRPDCIVAELNASSKRTALHDLSGLAASSLGFDTTAVLKALLAREELGSTGMGDGLAIPHARMSKVRKPFGVFARLHRAIEFDAVDGRPVDLVFLLLLPATGQGEQLNALACVARRLREPGTADSLRQAETARELFQALTHGEVA
jgi:PTS system nitrogen regulatory IIA component